MRRTATLLGVVGAAAVGMLLGARPGVAQEASRYPYDPVCPWGRLSNGKGMLVRCISQEEAAALPAGAKPAKPSASASAAPPPSASAAPSASASAEVPPEDPLKTYALKGISVTPDEGKLPTAEKKLAQGKDKMLECLGKHGGLEKLEGEAHVRFLVSARGRAEGVSVQKRVAMSAAAADCIAHVVDRRIVGTPESQMVGATAVIRLARLKK
ncbi:MAG: hypothetical protein IPM35_19195 [Myxococcales bacterium]|nr:hypothetical protein [Myxococcales bacterium]